MKRFEDIYTRRDQHADWNVVQAATLLFEGQERKCASLIIYSALEFRLAIEQLLFTVIAVGKGGTIDDETMIECHKKDGLFRVLEDVSPKYSLSCRFANVLASFYPEIPQIAEWDVRSLRRYYTALSELCHSQLVIRDFDVDPDGWRKKVELLEEVYRFLEAGFKKGTGVWKTQNADSTVDELWKEFSTGRINAEQLRTRFLIIKPVLDARRIHKP